jgi:hypothetical protein
METMKTGQSKQTNPEQQIERIYELRFCVVGGRDIPLRNQSVNGGTGVLRAKEGLEMAWFKSRRQIRIVETYRDRDMAPLTLWIPESWACWIPMPE